MSQFKFNLNDNATINASGESGQIIGRAEYVSVENQYHIRYKAADGRAVEAWWGESAIE
jgi:hypothetical protein